MRIGLRVCFGALALLASACMVWPEPRDYAIIRDITVPDSIGATQDLVISYTYMHGACDSDIKPQAYASPGYRSYAVLLTKPQSGNCIDLGIIPPALVYTVPVSERQSPFTVQFHGPGSVETRTVIWR